MNNKQTNKTASASQNCVHCHSPIHVENATWVDTTSGEGCTDDNGIEQTHQPSAPADKSAQVTVEEADKRLLGLLDTFAAVYMANDSEPAQDRLETMELIAQDTRKEFSYNKASGSWAWHNRDESSDSNGGFSTRLSALIDATEPYLD